MSRSGYSFEECPELNLYRGLITRSTAGKRGQRFFKRLLAALDALEKKELCKGFKDGENVCAIGSLLRAESVPFPNPNGFDTEAIGFTFDVTPQLVAEVMFKNDEGVRAQDAGHRFNRIRAWVSEQIQDHLAESERGNER
jgi:hypothetical protein